MSSSSAKYHNPHDSSTATEIDGERQTSVEGMFDLAIDFGKPLHGKAKFHVNAEETAVPADICLQYLEQEFKGHEMRELKKDLVMYILFIIGLCVCVTYNTKVATGILMFCAS